MFVLKCPHVTIGRESARSNMCRTLAAFTGVCLSTVGGGGVCPIACWNTHASQNQRQTPPGTRHPSWEQTAPGSRNSHPQDQTPPGADTPRTRHHLEQTPPGPDTPMSRQNQPTPPKQAPPWSRHPPPGSRHLPPVRILLECILVYFKNTKQLI